MFASWKFGTGSQRSLGIDYPIIQDPLGGLSSQRLTAAVSSFGGTLWIVRRARLGAGAIKDVIAQIRSGGCSMSLQRT